VSCQHLFRSGGGDAPPAPPLCPRLTTGRFRGSDPSIRNRRF